MAEKVAAYEEIEMADILRELYRRKWILLGLTLLAGCAIAAYTLTIPNVYESSAALIVREPQGAIVQEIDGPIARDARGMSVETLQTFAESTEMRRALFEQLWDKRAITRWQDPSADKLSVFRSFQRTLSSSVKRMQNQPRGTANVLPILILTARATTPDEAQIVANQWAELLETKSSEVYAQGIEVLDQFIGNMYTRSNQTLAKYETSLVTMKVEAGLALKEARRKKLGERIADLESDIVNTGVDISVNEVAIREGRRRIEEQLHEGQWLGDVVQHMAAAGLPYPFDIESFAPRVRELVRHAERKVRQAELLRDVRRGTNLISKQRELEHYEIDIARILGERASAVDELPAKQAALASLNEQLTAISEKLTLDKAITDDALWGAHISGALPEDAAMAPLKTEVENPVFQTVKELAVEAATRVEMLTSTAEQLDQSAEAAFERLAELERELDAIQREIDWREAQLEASANMLAMFREDFDTEASRVEELAIDNTRKQEEMEVKHELRDELAAEATALDEAILYATREIESLEREIENTRNIQNQLASKAEEVALLKISSEQAARTGTAILFRAEANPAKIAPARSKTVLSGMAVAFGALCFLVIGAKLVRETTNGAPQGQEA